MPVPSVVVVAVAVDNVSEKSILSSAIFHRTNVTAGLFYCVLADHFFACKEPAIKYYRNVIRGGGEEEGEEASFPRNNQSRLIISRSIARGLFSLPAKRINRKLFLVVLLQKQSKY